MAKFCWNSAEFRRNAQPRSRVVVVAIAAAANTKPPTHSGRLHRRCQSNRICRSYHRRPHLAPLSPPSMPPRSSPPPPHQRRKFPQRSYRWPSPLPRPPPSSLLSPVAFAATIAATITSLPFSPPMTPPRSSPPPPHRRRKFPHRSYHCWPSPSPRQPPPSLPSLVHKNGSQLVRSVGWWGVWVYRVLSKFSGALQINSTGVILRSQTRMSHHLSQKKNSAE